MEAEWTETGAETMSAEEGGRESAKGGGEERKELDAKKKRSKIVERLLLNL